MKEEFKLRLVTGVFSRYTELLQMMQLIYWPGLCFPFQNHAVQQGMKDRHSFGGCQSLVAGNVTVL